MGVSSPHLSHPQLEHHRHLLSPAMAPGLQHNQTLHGPGRGKADKDPHSQCLYSPIGNPVATSEE